MVRAGQSLGVGDVECGGEQVVLFRGGAGVVVADDGADAGQGVDEALVLDVAGGKIGPPQPLRTVLVPAAFIPELSPRRRHALT
ncbi:hypothetical protein HNR30_006467 [Nonomuraea soli]|uniref:Uncharacterized protein n=1 Tax=Nonomuraea soli TaxID=1032476 RepID=A0A7W0CPW1_9ACTN|nr:hypothetical protein [Nonomuraea soli]